METTHPDFLADFGSYFHLFYEEENHPDSTPREARLHCQPFPKKRDWEQKNHPGAQVMPKSYQREGQPRKTES